jgi:hypothetical protein
MRYVPTQQGTLAPFDLGAREFMASLHDAEPIELELVHARDMFEHRRILAQIGEVAKALHMDPSRLRAELLFKTGQFQLMGEMFGKTVIAINSMSRHHMKDPELHAFWDDAVEIIRTELLPLITDAAERERLASILSPERELG